MAYKVYESKVSYGEGKKIRDIAAPTSRLTSSTKGYAPSFSFLIAKSSTFSYVTSLNSFCYCYHFDNQRLLKLKMDQSGLIISMSDFTFFNLKSMF